MAGQKNEIAQSLALECRNDVDGKRPKGGGGKRERPGMVGGGAAHPIGDCRGDEKRAAAGEFAADCDGLQGIGGERQMVAVLFGGAERDEHRPAAGESFREFAHRHLVNEHGTLLCSEKWGVPKRRKRDKGPCRRPCCVRAAR